MNRKIESFFQDQTLDWVANLSCGHKQHVRHNPPLISRPWVLEESSRQHHIGTMLNCLRCDRLELPEGMALAQKTSLFTQDTIPNTLLNDHQLKNSNWGVINVLEGGLSYEIFITEDPIQMILNQGEKGVIPPQVLHRIKPIEKVKFFIEFYNPLSVSAQVISLPVKKNI